MSRETDTPSSGPNGRGGAAYPSGTPPYGTPMASGDGSDAGPSPAQPEERKTETTLTTRIRINIPGSRPIPPVVVRKPMGDTEGAAAVDTGADPRPQTPAPAPAAAPEVPDEPAAPAEERTSDWFAPRKSGANKGGPGGSGTNGAGMPGGSAAGSGTTGTSSASGAPGSPGKAGPASAPTAGGTGARPGGGRPGGVVGSMSVPGTSRPGGTNGAGLPGATGGPVAPGHGGGTGSFDVTEALNAGPLGGSRPGASGGDEPRRDDLPYFAENGGTGRGDGPGLPGAPSGTAGFGPAGGPGGAPGPGVPGGGAGGTGGRSGFNGPNGLGGSGGPQGPTGPTSGPVTGDGPVIPPVGGPGGLGDTGDIDLRSGESFTDMGGFDVPSGFDAPAGSGAYDAPGEANGLGGHGGPFAPGAALSDDTAILTPQKPAPDGTPGYGSPADNVSGHTVTSGIPVVPSAGNSPFGQGARAEGQGPHTAPKLPEPVAPPKAEAKPQKKKGRSKLVLLCVGVVVLASGAYGAGLLMNHTDVPKGTTVLGVDIGGGTRDDAVKKLDDAFGSRVNKPLKLSVGGKTVSLTPENAGLQFDFQATVGKAATNDYNPVSVIGNLFGQQRTVDPAMPVDEEKLQVALQQAGGGSGSVTEGGIEFKSGQAVAVYGKAGKAIDAAQSTRAVEQAYRTQVETGTVTPVTVPTTTKQPTVSKVEVDREMKAFAEPAMSGIVTVQTDAAHSVRMSPQKSLWKFLRVAATPDGKLTDKPDLNALQQLYGHAFDNVLITRASGKKTAVTPQDVYVALRQALVSKTNRVAVISTTPN
ncbi:hypothetical protein [Streptomyces sp. NPDC047028]|uniref:hypothetical protein n=1 Tax=Streptomyces sp. NPDC047028 TaxID=3155793 RepID=UPI0033D01C51